MPTPPRVPQPHPGSRPRPPRRWRHPRRLAACAPSEQTATLPKAGERPAQLRLHVRTGSEADTLEERLPALTQKFPRLTVTIEPFPGGGTRTKIG